MTPKFSHETLPLHSTASEATFEVDVWRYFHPDATKTVVTLDKRLDDLVVGMWVEVVDAVVQDQVVFEPLKILQRSDNT